MIDFDAVYRELVAPAISEAGLDPLGADEEMRIASGKPDYWDYATRPELAVLEKNEEKAFDAIAQALANTRESWSLQRPRATFD